MSFAITIFTVSFKLIFQSRARSDRMINRSAMYTYFYLFTSIHSIFICIIFRTIQGTMSIGLTESTMKNLIVVYSCRKIQSRDTTKPEAPPPRFSFDGFDIVFFLRVLTNVLITLFAFSII